MSETCTVETGLLKKHACGAPAATKCANCEQPLCAKHAAPKMSAGKKLFLCPECAKAWKQIGDLPEPAAAPAEKNPPAAPAKPPAPKPAAAPKPAPAPAAKKPEPAVEHSGALEFTPGNKPSAPEKKAEPPPSPPSTPAPAPVPGKFELSIEQSAPPEPKPDEKK